MIRQLITFCLLLVLLSLTATTVSAETSAVPFLGFNPSARAAGMGQSSVAVADDAYATFWNPAGLAHLSNRQVAFTRIDWLPDLDFGLAYYYVTYSQRLEDWGNFGLTLTYFDMGEYLKTDENATELGYDKAYDGAVTLSYGTDLMSGLALGLNMRFVYSHLADEEQGIGSDKSGTGMTWATDIGFLYDVYGIPNLRLGMNFQNLGPDISYINEDQADPIPRTFKAGLAYARDFSGLKVTGTAEYDKILIRTDDGFSEELKECTWGLGTEIWYTTLLNSESGLGFGGGLRFGYSQNREGQPGEDGESYIDGTTFGGGVSLEFNTYTIEIDYGMAPGGDLSDYNRFYSLAINF